MATSPTVDADGVLNVTISSNKKVLKNLPLMTVTVRRAFNRIPWAELVIQDGDMTTGKFEYADTSVFEPGAVVTISAGFGSDSAQIFSGVVVRYGVRIEGQNESRLVVECRDTATKMTVGRNNANYVQKTDSDILTALIGAHGLTANVASTTQQHDELVQYYCNDWDFLLARAEVNGMLVNVDAGTVNVQPPKADGDAVLTVTWGSNLYEFDAEIDARLQFKSAQAVAWNPAQQQIVMGEAAAPGTLNAQGNLKPAALADVAGPEVMRLQTATTQEQSALTTWAKALQVKATLARIRGRLRCQGNALVIPGALVAVSGVGLRFQGSVFVSAVEHTMAGGQWFADVEFGLDPRWHMMRDDVAAPLASGLLPGVGGLQIGVVKKLDGDPQNAQRIQVALPVMQAQTEGIWARLVQGYASNTFGMFFLPEVGDEVIVGYLNDDPSHPVVLGSLYSAGHTPPYAIEAPNDTKAIVTRAQHKIEFNEKDKIVTITTPGNNKVVLDDKDKSILVQDQNGNSVKLSGSGIALDSPYDITANAKGNIQLKAAASIEISAQADIKANAINIGCEAQAGFTGKGAATAELSASGQTTVRGGVVMIN
ncbi:type VI secretion protein VgrG [Ralstonia sp. A12]|uniref:type VI secretion system tip protein VgrG n=1 Tax=Ralstonia sp. A12 TaxID=1217052 RepID=UPI000574A4D8|nr:type VI secretion system tip protein VgrG [Ralstonia sp. A12]KHK49722.1 type VI secretion protein VgrG [Ralstonia sp. A12]